MFAILDRYMANSVEEAAAYEVIYSRTQYKAGDKKLYAIAALTYNPQTCSKIFIIIEKALEPKESTWTTLFNCVLLVHTILLFGSETAVDKILNINRFIKPLQTYNSALVKGRGTDYGAPVREEAKVLLKLLTSDSTIRSARQNSRKEAGVLVPLGAESKESITHESLEFGQGAHKAAGAVYGLEMIPGMYENRPERDDARFRAVGSTNDTNDEEEEEDMEDAVNGAHDDGDHDDGAKDDGDIAKDSTAVDLLNFDMDTIAVVPLHSKPASAVAAQNVDIFSSLAAASSPAYSSPAHQQFPPQIQQFPPQIQQFPPQIQQFPSQFQQIPAQIQQIPAQIPLIPPQIQLIPAQIQQIPAQIQQIPAQFQSVQPLISPQVQHVPAMQPQTPHFSPQFQQFPPQVQQFSPEVQQSPPHAREFPPKSDQLVMSGMAPPATSVGEIHGLVVPKVEAAAFETAKPTSLGHNNGIAHPAVDVPVQVPEHLVVNPCAAPSSKLDNFLASQMASFSLSAVATTNSGPIVTAEENTLSASTRFEGSASTMGMQQDVYSSPPYIPNAPIVRMAPNAPIAPHIPMSSVYANSFSTHNVHNAWHPMQPPAPPMSATYAYTGMDDLPPPPPPPLPPSYDLSDLPPPPPVPAIPPY